MPVLSTFSFNHLPIAAAVIGFIVCFFFGSRLITIDRNAPIAAGGIGAVVFYFAAECLLWILVIVAVIWTARLALRSWSSVHEAVQTFAREAGLRTRRDPSRRPFSNRLSAMYAEFQNRTEAIRGLRLPASDEEECLDAVQTKFSASVTKLSHTDFPTEV